MFKARTEIPNYRIKLWKRQFFSSIFIVEDIKVHFIEIISRRRADFTKAVLQVIKVQVCQFLMGLKESLAYYNKPEYQLQT